MHRIGIDNDEQREFERFFEISFSLPSIEFYQQGAEHRGECQAVEKLSVVGMIGWLKQIRQLGRQCSQAGADLGLQTLLTGLIFLVSQAATDNNRRREFVGWPVYVISPWSRP